MLSSRSHIRALSILLVLSFFNASVRWAESGPVGCVDGPARNLPFCKQSLPIQYRVRDLIGRLTLPEKIGLLVNNAAPVPRLGIRGYEWWSEALHGVSNTGPGVRFGGRFPGATSFPQVISTAASFNASLWEQIGRVVSDEARAMYNGGAAGLSYWSPNVNIFRDPRWGRGQETPGEDPKVVADYGVRYVRGLQGTGAPGNRLKVAACCKHYTAYDLDNWRGVDRFHFNARVSKQDMADTFNVPFQQCVARGKVACVMCSYNQVNGKPTCADPALLRGTIRNQWRLDGYIVSDCDSVDVLHRIQRYTRTPEDAVAQTLKAGLDLDCGPFLSVHTGAAIQQGKAKEADVNWALANTLTVQMRLGLYDSPSSSPFGRLGPRDVCTAAHKELALEAARQGIVLLQNRGRSLPLLMRHHRTVAVIGPNADATATMIGNYAGVPCGYTTTLQGIGRYAKKTIFEKGCATVACPGGRLFGAAETAARQADATVLVMGLDQSIEKETLDRTSLLLPGYQQQLVSRVARASKGPTILVLMSGGPIDVTFAKNDPRISAIVWAGYPGQAGGAAIADVLFGIHNPGGKLPMTWYPQSYVRDLAMTRMDMRASRGYPGRTYRFYRGLVVFPFGYGLSYTAFAHSLASEPPADLSVPLSAALANPTNSSSASSSSSLLVSSNLIRVSHANCDNLSIGLDLHVKNTGDVHGSHTVLVFATPPSEAGGKGGEPTKQLVDYRKVHVAAGSQQRLRFQVHVCKHLSVADQFGIRRIPIGKHTLHIGDDLKHTVSLQTTLGSIHIP